jgi:O-antigen/teichoic acid export membrane protein
MRLAHNILVTLSARILVLTFSLVSSVVLARSLGPEGRGLLTLILLLPELAISFALFGFEQANTVYAGLEPGGRRALVWQSGALATLVGGSVAIASACFLTLHAPGADKLLHGPLWLYLLALAKVPASLVITYWWAILRGMNRIVLLNSVEVGSRGVSLVAVVTFIGWLSPGVAGAVWADCLVTGSTVILMVALLRYVGICGRPVFDRSIWRRTRRFALPAYCASVMSYLNYRADQFIIATMLPPEQLGFYAIAVGLSEPLWILTGAVANALLPHLTNSKQRDPALPAAVARHVLVWTAGVCLLAFAFAGVGVRGLYSSAFIDVVSPLRWLLIGTFTATAGKVLIAEMLVREKVYFTIRVSIIAAAVNILGNIVLIPSMGIAGAALASSLSYSLLSGVVTVYYLRETGVKWTALVPRRSDLLAYRTLWRDLMSVICLRRSTPGGVIP